MARNFKGYVHMHSDAQMHAVKITGGTLEVMKNFLDVQ